MTDLADIVGVHDPLWREREALAAKGRRSDRAAWLAWGGFCGCLIFVVLVGLVA